MQAQAHIVGTPAEFGQTIIGFEYDVCPLLDLPREFEPVVQKSLDEIFGELANVGQEDAQGVSAYLNTIEQPLERLQQIGVTIFVIVVSGLTKQVSDVEIADWRCSYYLIIWKDSYFRVADDLSQHVHRFAPDCRQALDQIAHTMLSKQQLKNWLTTEAVQIDYEGSVPWCPECCADLLNR